MAGIIFIRANRYHATRFNVNSNVNLNQQVYGIIKSWIQFQSLRTILDGLFDISIALMNFYEIKMCSCGFGEFGQLEIRIVLFGVKINRNFVRFFQLL